jgi:hypothetical protein
MGRRRFNIKSGKMRERRKTKKGRRGGVIGGVGECG